MALRLSDPRSSRAGLFFCHRLRSHSRMDPDLENVIRQALEDAQAARDWYASDTYQSVISTREQAMDAVFIVVEDLPQ